MYILFKKCSELLNETLKPCLIINIYFVTVKRDFIGYYPWLFKLDWSWYRIEFLLRIFLGLQLIRNTFPEVGNVCLENRKSHTEASLKLAYKNRYVWRRITVVQNLEIVFTHISYFFSWFFNVSLSRRRWRWFWTLSTNF